MERWAYDLQMLGSKIRNVRRLSALADAIDRYHSAFSLQADLQEAKRTIDTLHEVTNAEGERARFAAALMTHAVVLYARATISDQDGRRQVDVTKAFSDDLKKKHLAIADLRNTVVAHYGVPRGEHARRWNDERTILRWHPEGRSFSYLCSRAGYVAEAVNDLALLTRHAGMAVATAIEDRGLKLQAQLIKFENDPEVIAAAQSCKFKPETFYITAAAVAAFWDAADTFQAG